VYVNNYSKVKSDTEAAGATCEKDATITKTESCSLSDMTSNTEKDSDSCEADHTTSSAQSVNNHLDLENDSQSLIKAVGNLNAVASGAALQANIAANVGVNGTISQANSATVASGL